MDVLQHLLQLREDHLVAGDRSEDRYHLGGDVLAHPGGVRGDVAAAEHGVAVDAHRVGNRARDQRDQRRRPAAARTGSALSTRVIPTSVAEQLLDLLRHVLRRRRAGADEQRVVGHHAQRRHPRRVDDGVDQRLLLDVGADVHRRRIGGATEPQVVVLVRRQLALEPLLERELTAGHAVPGVLEVGVLRRCEAPVGARVDRGHRQLLVLDHRVGQRELHRRHVLQLLDRRDRGRVERRSAHDQDVGGREDARLPRAGRRDGVALLDGRRCRRARSAGRGARGRLRVGRAGVAGARGTEDQHRNCGGPRQRASYPCHLPSRRQG